MSHVLLIFSCIDEDPEGHSGYSSKQSKRKNQKLNYFRYIFLIFWKYCLFFFFWSCDNRSSPMECNSIVYKIHVESSAYFSAEFVIIVNPQESIKYPFCAKCQVTGSGAFRISLPFATGYSSWKGVAMQRWGEGLSSFLIRDHRKFSNLL